MISFLPTSIPHRDRICFYLDENIDRRIVAPLRQHGIIVITSEDVGLQGEKDDLMHLRKATELGCVLVTGDRDFEMLDREINVQWLKNPQQCHAGIIFVIPRLRPRAPGELVNKLIEIHETRKPDSSSISFGKSEATQDIMADSIVLTTVRIVSTPGVLGGKPRIEGTRMSVEQVAAYHAHAGWPLEEIAEAFNLTLGQIHAALAYYYDHRGEIDQAIQRQFDEGERLTYELKKFARSDDVLSAVMTAPAAAREFNIDPRTVLDAIEHGWIKAHKSAGTWLIRRADAEARWGKRK